MSTGSRNRRSGTRGMSLLYTIVVLSVLLGFASLGVDLARVQVAKTELRTAVDAAARAGAAGLSNAAARDNAVVIAAAHSVDGTPLDLDAVDVVLGTWDLRTRTFSPLVAGSSGADAVQVTGRRTAQRGNPIPLIFARVLGASTCDATATAIAFCEPGNKLQLVGTSSVNVMNNFYAGVYRSSSTKNPNSASSIDGATVASNGAITAGMNENVNSSILGPSGSSNLTTSAGTVRLTADMSFALPSTSLSAYGDMSVTSGTYQVPGGTYHVDDLTMANRSTLSFNGPATLYISGNVKFNGDVSIYAYDNVPGNLKIYHTGSASFGSASANNVNIVADVYAPGADLAVKNNATLHGRFIFNSVLAKNNLTFFYDDDLHPPVYAGGTGGAVSLVK